MEVLFTCLGGRRRRREEEEDEGGEVEKEDEVEKEERWRMKSRRGKRLERVQQPCLWCGAEAS